MTSGGGFFGWLKRLFAPAPSVPRTMIADEKKAVEEFARHLGIHFNDPELLKLALTHRSFLHLQRGTSRQSNERLEFLGDSVLGVIVSEHLYKVHPTEHEGQLTKTKSLLVSKAILSRRGLAMGLGRFVLMSNSEVDSGGRQRLSILADAFEAVLGAIYLDQGIEAARKFVETWLLAEARGIVQDKRHTNYKSLLQEYVQSAFHTHPVYRIRHEHGPDHSKLFTVEVIVSGRNLGSGRGKNKKEAEQSAARDALDRVAEKAGERREPREEEAMVEAPERARSAERRPREERREREPRAEWEARPEREPRAEREPRPEREARPEREPRVEREPRADRPPRMERPERPERAERAERPDSPEAGEIAERGERIERSERPPRAEREPRGARGRGRPDRGPRPIEPFAADPASEPQTARETPRETPREATREPEREVAREPMTRVERPPARAGETDLSGLTWTTAAPGRSGMAYGRQPAIKARHGKHGLPASDPTRQSVASESPATAPRGTPIPGASAAPRTATPRVDVEVKDVVGPPPGVDAARYRAAESPIARFSSETPSAWEDEPKEYE